MKLHPKVFRDMHGKEIKAGDILFRTVIVRERERPHHKRVAICHMSGEESIVSDEGKLLEPKRHWITRKVGWNGACMIAEKGECSDGNGLANGELFDEDGESVFERVANLAMNNSFDSRAYSIRNP